ncbi:hypothetical protein KAW18_01835 [candidate division WOR-3 bacterium]|nr:hypothetical protein [candidate division WOR-3 bacterium]
MTSKTLKDKYFFIKCEDRERGVKGCFVSKKQGKILKHNHKEYFILLPKKKLELGIRVLLGAKRKEFLDRFGLVLDIKTKTIRPKKVVVEKDKIIKSGVGKPFHKYDGRKVYLIKLGGVPKIFLYKIKIEEGGRMTTEKVKFYKTKVQAENQFKNMVGIRR